MCGQKLSFFCFFHLIRRLMLIFPFQMNTKKSFRFCAAVCYSENISKTLLWGTLYALAGPSAECSSAVQRYRNCIRSKCWIHGGGLWRAGKGKSQTSTFFPKTDMGMRLDVSGIQQLILGLLVCPNVNSLGWYHISISWSNFHRMLSNLGEKGRNCKKNVKASA